MRMKLSFFFVLSAAFHALVLALPVYRTEAEKEKLLPVTIVALAEPKVAWTPQPERSRQKNPILHPKPLPPVVTSEGVEAKAAEAASFARVSDQVPAAAQRLKGASVPDAPEANPEPPPLEAPWLEDSEQAFAVEAFARRDSTAVQRNTIADVGPGTANKNEQATAKEAAGAAAPPPVEIAAARDIAKALPKRAAAPLSSPRYSHNPPPQYPESARRDGSEGTVFLAVLIDAQGKPRKIEISQSSGTPSLDEAATKSVRGWRFHPARQGERAVESWVKIPIVFQLARR